MHKLSMRLVFAGFGIAICAHSFTARAQSPENASCPAGYWLMGTLCLNSATGDVEKAAPAAASQVAAEPGCGRGYSRLGSLCFSSATGDVERVDETRWPAGQRAGARNR
jgi:hypothetical protein